MTKEEMIDIIKKEEMYLWMALQEQCRKGEDCDIYVKIAIKNQWFAIERIAHKLAIEI